METKSDRGGAYVLLSVAAAVVVAIIAWIIVPPLLAVHTAKQEVRNLLVDPNSALFSFVARKATTVCGFVNSRNSFGGFTGPVPFMVKTRLDGSVDVDIIDPVTAADVPRLNNVCPAEFLLESNKRITRDAIETLEALSQP